MKASTTEGVGYHEMKQHKPCFDEECSKLFDQWKQTELQWLQNPSQTNGDNLDNVRCEKKREYLELI